MSQLNSNQRQKLLLIKEIIEQSLSHNTSQEIEQIQKLSLQLTGQESLVVKPFRPPEGLTILLENVFFRDLLALVQSVEFQVFYNKHMAVDHKPALIYLELHQVLQKIYISEYDTPMSAEMGALVLKTIIHEKKLRAPLIRLILRYLDGETNKKDTYNSVKRILVTHLLDNET